MLKTSRQGDPTTPVLGKDWDAIGGKGLARHLHRRA
jgi:hypothetical protein